MANLPNNPFAELRNLEARVDQRLDMLGRAEANLKSLLDSLRQQVGVAFPVVDQLNKLLPEARLQAETAATLPSIGEMSAALSVGVDQARSELEERAGQMRQQMIDDLQAAIGQAKASFLAGDIGKPSQDEMAALVAAFRSEAKTTLDCVRETLADELDLLQSHAKLHIDPLLNDIDNTRRSAEMTVRLASETAQNDMRRRAEQLKQSIDDIAVVLEQRLTQRTAALQHRAEESMAALKPAMDERLDALLNALEQTIVTRERELMARIDSYPARLDRQLADAEAQLMDRIARTEKHATDMTAYLESKLTTRVDELVARLRLRLQKELNEVAGTPTPENRRPNPLRSPLTPPPAPPTLASMTDDAHSLQASVFVERRPNLNPAA